MNTTKPTEAAIRAAKAIRDAEPNLMIKSQEDIAQIIDREFAELVEAVSDAAHSDGENITVAEWIRIESALAKLNAK